MSRPDRHPAYDALRGVLYNVKILKHSVGTGTFNVALKQLFIAALSAEATLDLPDRKRQSKTLTPDLVTRVVTSEQLWLAPSVYGESAMKGPHAIERMLALLPSVRQLERSKQQMLIGEDSDAPAGWATAGD